MTLNVTTVAEASAATHVFRRGLTDAAKAAGIGRIL